MIPLPSSLGDIAAPAVVAPSGITLVGTTTNGSSTSSLTLTQPAGVAAGDVGIITAAGDAAISVPSGWTNTGGIFYKVYGASEGSVALTASGASRFTASIAVFRGCNSTPIDVSSAASTFSGNTVPTSAITPTHAGDVLVNIAVCQATANDPTFAIDKGAVIAYGTYYQYGAAIATGPAQSVGVSTGTVTWTLGASVYYATASMILLKQV